jgi:hypothetical protein
MRIVSGPFGPVLIDRGGKATPLWKVAKKPTAIPANANPANPLHRVAYRIKDQLFHEVPEPDVLSPDAGEGEPSGVGPDLPAEAQAEA